MKCGYCQQPINMALNGFSGIKKKKFCQSCWSKIHSVWDGIRIMEEEPQILNFVLRIKL
jgi:hypothetical protein